MLRHGNWTGVVDLSAYSRADRWDSEYLAKLDGPLMLVVNSSTIDCLGHDPLYSPVALVDSSGLAVERMEYDAYGKQYYRFTPDVNGDGSVDAGDSNVVSNRFGVVLSDMESYRCDINGDGYVTASDLGVIWDNWGAWAGSGQRWSGNPVGFTGRTLDLLDGGDLAVMYYRHRTYGPGIGRFGQLDSFGLFSNQIRPRAQYQDGMNRYQYVKSRPVNKFDPYGLNALGCDSFPDLNSAVQECCAAHDICYSNLDKVGSGHECTGHSWLCAGSSDPLDAYCKKCNNEAVGCILSNLFNFYDDPLRPNYWCAKCKVWVCGPNDSPDDTGCRPMSEHEGHESNPTPFECKRKCVKWGWERSTSGIHSRVCLKWEITHHYHE